MNTTTKNTRASSDLSRGTIVKSFPIVCARLHVDDTQYVWYAGKSYKIKRIGNGEYDVIATRA